VYALGLFMYKFAAIPWIGTRPPGGRSSEDNYYTEIAQRRRASAFSGKLVIHWLNVYSTNLRAIPGSGRGGNETLEGGDRVKRSVRSGSEAPSSARARVARSPDPYRTDI